MAEPVALFESTDLVEVAAELVRGRHLVALAGGKLVTIDSIVKTILEEGLAGNVKEADVPRLSGRLGLRRAAELYAVSGGKYLALLKTKPEALTPRSMLKVAAKRITVLEIASLATPPAIAAPNATLKGVMRRMVKRGSVCVFIARAGRIKGVVDAWTAVQAVVDEGEKAFDRSCCEVLCRSAVCESISELMGALTEYGFAAVPGSKPLLIDDVSLLNALRATFSRWRRELKRRGRRGG